MKYPSRPHQYSVRNCLAKPRTATGSHSHTAAFISPPPEARMFNSVFNAFQPATNLVDLLWTPPQEKVRQLPGDTTTRTCPLPGNAKLLYVRDPQAMHKLAVDPAVDRGPGLVLLRSIFGAGTTFLLPRGKPHSQAAGQVNRHLSREKVEALAPELADFAVKAVERVRDTVEARGSASVDLRQVVLGYLMDCGARAIAGVPVDLSSQVAVFQRGVDALHEEASSVLKTALAAAQPWAANFMAPKARQAAAKFQEAGRLMLVAAAEQHDLRDSLALATMKGWRIDPERVTADSDFPRELKAKVSMDLAASLFTTANLIEMTLHHLYTHPQELETLRTAIQADFPHGVGELTALSECETYRLLLPLLTAHTPVAIVSRDVVKSTSFTDCHGQRHDLCAGDAVIFDIEGMQARQRPDLERQLAAEDDGAKALKMMDRCPRGAMSMFYTGDNVCSGRYLAMAEAFLLIVQMVKTLDGEPAKGRQVIRGIVNHLDGDPKVEMRLAPPVPGARPGAAISPPSPASASA